MKDSTVGMPRARRTRCRNPPARVIFILLGFNLQRYWSIWHPASAYRHTWTYVGWHPKETYRSSRWIFASFSVVLESFFFPPLPYSDVTYLFLFHHSPLFQKDSLPHKCPPSSPLLNEQSNLGCGVRILFGNVSVLNVCKKRISNVLKNSLTDFFFKGIRLNLFETYKVIYFKGIRLNLFVIRQHKFADQFWQQEKI
ncbi:hypothetical protein CDAR_581931 [Caerostris darwini]|uniref:Uncharacterized protein n=1 Tax=Caerostris darwini TaxID=1538125 RepID=A0AAV4X6Q6_9ARAC|nr:hypothetical protein CDAR_581931 [Caerostris darwini]